METQKAHYDLIDAHSRVMTTFRNVTSIHAVSTASTFQLSNADGIMAIINLGPGERLERAK